jgi:hypothetical protein
MGFSINGLPPQQALLAFGLFLALFAALIVFKRVQGKPKIIAPRLPKSAMAEKPDKEGWRLGKYIFSNVCPDCGNEDFYEGLGNGKSVCIFCSNPECRHGFNVLNFGDGDVWAERINNGPDRLY